MPYFCTPEGFCIAYGTSALHRACVSNGVREDWLINLLGEADMPLANFPENCWMKKRMNSARQRLNPQ